MSAPEIRIHPSASPEAVVELLRDSLQQGELAPRFHYSGGQQASRWLEVHRAFSPSRLDDRCLGMYRRAFLQASQETSGKHGVRVVGVGCGGGQKDGLLVDRCLQRSMKIFYTAADISGELVGEACQEVGKRLSDENVEGWVVDFLRAPEWRPGGVDHSACRVFSAIGMVPNLDPELFLMAVASWAEEGDILVLGANLAPGNDYMAGCRKVLPQYDNAPTRRWLGTFLEDQAVPAEAWDMDFVIGERSGILRIESWARFRRRVELGSSPSGKYGFGPDRPLLLFHSNRFLPGQLRTLLAYCGWSVRWEEILPSQEEGVWVCRRKPPR